MYNKNFFQRERDQGIKAYCTGAWRVKYIPVFSNISIKV
jgi:hypothetical protein